MQIEETKKMARRVTAEETGVNYGDMGNGLSKAMNAFLPYNNYNSWELDFLADHITNVHHTYLQENIPLLAKYAARVVQVYRSNHPELIQVQRLFSILAKDLKGHCNKEKSILFPFVKRMVEAKKKGGILEVSKFRTIHGPITAMEEDHQEAKATFRRIAALTSNYAPPEGACNIFRIFYSKLDEFEQKLHEHVHLESNILFPKLTELEREWVAA